MAIKREREQVRRFKTRTTLTRTVEVGHEAGGVVEPELRREMRHVIRVNEPNARGQTFLIP